MMNSSESSAVKIKKFDGKDFNLWKSKVENSLMYLDLDGYLTVKGEGEDKVKKDKKALAFIKDSLSDTLFRRYNETSAKELWDKLKVDFATVDAQMLFM